MWLENSQSLKEAEKKGTKAPRADKDGEKTLK